MSTSNKTKREREPIRTLTNKELRTIALRILCGILVAVTIWAYFAAIPRNIFEEASYTVDKWYKHEGDYAYQGNGYADMPNFSWSVSYESKLDDSRFWARSKDNCFVCMPIGMGIQTYDEYDEAGNQIETRGKFNEARYISVAVILKYSRSGQHLDEYVEVRTLQDGWLQVTDNPREILTQLGITDDELKQKRDWLLYDKVLPMIMGRPVTPEDLDDVNITTDEFLG
jgi:hypothetical protein